MKRLFVEADELGQWVNGQSFGIHETWQDHGAGLLLTLANQAGHPFEVLTLKAMHSWAEVRMRLKGYDLLAMNVRSWRYAFAKRTAELFKAVNPEGVVVVGGMHATVAPQEMLAVEQFGDIVQGEGEGTWLDLLAIYEDGIRPLTPNLVPGSVGKYTSLDDLPFVDRSLWPRTPDAAAWPLESPGGWGPGKRAATMITSRMCPWHCSFCAPAERKHFKVLRRRSVGSTLAELLEVQARWGEFGTVVFHDSEFLMMRSWLEEFLTRYPSETPAWPFWASLRADQVARWPDLVRALHKDAHWHCFSIGLESGSQRVLDIMNKETTVEQNEAAIELVNGFVDEAERESRRPPVIFANVMLAIPGEEPEDAFATIRMLSRIKRVIPSVSWMTPYPGSALGDKIIAEGRSLDTHKKYLRFPNEPKIAGIDYQFYVDLFNGKYDRECGLSVPRLLRSQGSAGEALA